jgi:hypothetical protein
MFFLRSAPSIVLSFFNIFEAPRTVIFSILAINIRIFTVSSGNQISKLCFSFFSSCCLYLFFFSLFLNPLILDNLEADVGQHVLFQNTELSNRQMNYIQTHSVDNWVYLNIYAESLYIRVVHGCSDFENS